MAFDIGIGKCRSITNDTVDVWVDSSVVRRILPDVAWKQAGISVLRIPQTVCSTVRPLVVGEEVFLGSDALNAKSFGQLDFHVPGISAVLAWESWCPSSTKASRRRRAGRTAGAEASPAKAVHPEKAATAADCPPVPARLKCRDRGDGR